MGAWGEAYLARLRECAAESGRELADISGRDRSVRLVESDARTVEEGFAEQLLSTDGGQVRTRDPLQTPLALIEDDPARPRWEALAQLAGYVELVRLGYPQGALRVATRDDELGLDLAAVADDGRPLVIGAARAEPLLLSKLEALVPTFEVEGPRTVRSSLACDAYQVFTQLWLTRAPYLWLVAPGARRTLRVSYGRTITLSTLLRLPRPEDLWPYGFEGGFPRIASNGLQHRAICT